MKQQVEQLYTVSVYIRNIQCTKYYCVPIVILRSSSGRAWNTANKQPKLRFHVRNRPEIDKLSKSYA